MNKIFGIIICLILAQLTYGQKADPVLFKVENQAVHVSEFDYIYNKNNGEGANYSEESLQEYLDLYTKFKLKVQRARDLQIDTIKDLQTELAGYRKQLSDSYLVDKEVSNRLVKELFERKQHDRRVSHIFVAVDTKTSDKKLAEAKEKIQEAQKLLSSGKKFGAVALEISEDNNSAIKDGDIGFYTAMLPAGFYEFENALYNTAVGSTSEIVRTPIGFHILKVTEERPARGELEVAHIMIRKPKGEVTTTGRAKIDSVYSFLSQGGEFTELAKIYSEDTKTKAKGGYLGYFGINKYEKSFEDAAFALKNNGDFTKPVETKNGIHIIKRIKKKDQSDYTKIKGRLENQISKDDRFTVAKKTLVNNIKDEMGYKENPTVLAKFTNQLTDEFYSFKWKAPEMQDEVLFSFGSNKETKIQEFVEYCKKNTRTRLKFKKTMPKQEAVETLYETFVSDKAMFYEEANLEKKYPEFKSLMREYEEGILLFEITKREVWDKASQDSVGLKAYFDNNRDNYVWKERAKVWKYSVQSDDKKLIEEIKKFAKKNDMKATTEKFNTSEKPVVRISEMTIEKDDNLAKQIKWKKDKISDVIMDKGKSNFYKVIEMIPGGRKEMAESRGYIIADYQDQLENNWVQDLKEAYRVELNEKVFKSLIKK
jgi:peptidyl-prolyl cis-trans isomerase SurA